MRKTMWGGFLICITTAAAGHAQTAMGNQQQNLGSNQSIAAAILQPVAGAPYQAEKVSRSVQKLGDGTVITQEFRGLIARDTQGRIREDLYIVHSGQVAGQQRDLSLQSATVGDPVAHTMLIWTDEKTKIAMQMQLPSIPASGIGGVMGGIIAGPPPSPMPGGVRRANNNMPSVSLLSAAGANGPKDDVRTEDLGQQSLNGILVTGKRTTTTIPLGKVGNDRPFVVVHEEWRSPELKILVKTIDTDPRTGEQTMELQGLTRADPDAALFQVPAGYKVQDMADMLKGLGNLGRPKAQ